jgi:hypothetical protein
VTLQTGPDRLNQVPQQADLARNESFKVLEASEFQGKTPRFYFEALKPCNFETWAKAFYFE